MVVAQTDAEYVQRALDTLGGLGTTLSVKLYRIRLDPPLTIPVIPCLDHEAMLHQRIDPHAGAYLQERTSGDLHEVVFFPAKRQIMVDTVSTWGECSPQSHAELLSWLATAFPFHAVSVTRPTWWRGDRRVAAACRAQVSLRDVLLADDMEAVEASVDRLRTISAYMEKQSRVASWAVRTVTAPILAATGVVAFLVLGLFTARLGAAGVDALRYAMLGVLGALFLYYGLKAVQLTEMSNRVWKRTAEYALILKERRKGSQVP